jgi:hypothetical protein
MLKNKTRLYYFVLTFATLLSTGIYVLSSHLYNRVGYPLDDSWIYQTYARNLGQLGEWSFIPGETSGGSTGPLWVLIVSIGYLLRLNHHIWTLITGSLILFCIGIVGMRAMKLLSPNAKRITFLVGIILVFEWHLVWASMSGMETLLAALLVTATLVYLFKTHFTNRDWLFIGLLVGISVWIRPDAITLLGPVGFTLLFGSKTSIKGKIKPGLFVILGLTIPIGGYLLFNQITSGTLWPNTFYAKQAEYAELQKLSFATRFADQFAELLSGVGVVLLPGFFLTLLKTSRERSWGLMASFLWFFGYLAIFAWRLPVTYQHGRYIMPAMPIFFILGLTGTLNWNRQNWQEGQMIFRVLAKVWLLSCLSITALYWLFGANAFAGDVAVIESEMVTTSQWIRNHTSTDALIAAHDIGALGYLSERQIVDLAGLISPDVIPFIRDEALLAEYLDEKNVDFLMTFPEWYPSLTANSTLIFQTEGTFSPRFGGENMAVYKWDGSESKK